MSTIEPEVIPVDDTNRERLLWIGPDVRGLVPEIGAIVEPDYVLLIHVMRRRFRRSSS